MEGASEGGADVDDVEVQLGQCRFVAEAAHPQFGAVFLFYTTSDAGHPFYVALVDERFQRRRGTSPAAVRPKTLNIVKRIKRIVLRRKVDRDSRGTLIESNTSSRSASCTSQASAARDESFDCPTDVLWCDLLLDLSECAASDDVEPFTLECQRNLHDAGKVRDLYETSAHASIGALPVHVCLRQLQITPSAIPEASHSPNDLAESTFVALCDPLFLPRQSDPLSFPTGTSVVGRDGPVLATPSKPSDFDALSPMTPTATVDGAHGAVNDANDDTSTLANAAKLSRSTSAYYVRKACSGERGMRTPPLLLGAPSSTALQTIPGLFSASKSVVSRRAAHRKWDCSYL